MPWDTCFSSKLHVGFIPCHGIFVFHRNYMWNLSHAMGYSFFHGNYMWDLSHAMGYLFFIEMICGIYPMPWDTRFSSKVHVGFSACHGIFGFHRNDMWDLSHAMENLFVIESTCGIYPMPWDICLSSREKTCGSYPMPWDICLSSRIHVRIIACHGISVCHRNYMWDLSHAMGYFFHRYYMWNLSHAMGYLFFIGITCGIYQMPWDICFSSK